MISTFIDRDNERSLLEHEWKKHDGSLVILYGRRRIGKTRLLVEFGADKKGIFYVAEDASPLIQIGGLKDKIAHFLGDSLLPTLELKDWDQVFGYLVKNAPSSRFFLIIDEFSYLVKNDRRILSVLQKYWDGGLSTSNICILLSGSILGLMSETVLSYASPLYGRRTRDILLEGLSFNHARNFLSMPFEENLQTYMIIGGVPEYLLKASEHLNLSGFLHREFLSKHGYFYREPYYILSQEFKELKTYFSILNAIAFGNTRPTAIANFVGVDSREIYPYLENLLRLNFIEREVAIIGNSKKGIYTIKDPLFDFWFNFVLRFREEIERNQVQLSQERLATFMGKKFESFVRKEWVPLFLPNFPKIGRWWYKEEEIDVVALYESQKEVAFIECKWKVLDPSEVKKILRNLQQKATSVRWENSNRKETFGIVAKFVQNKEELRKAGYLIYDLEDLEQMIKTR